MAYSLRVAYLRSLASFNRSEADTRRPTRRFLEVATPLRNSDQTRADHGVTSEWKARRQGFVARLSLEHKLPLFIGAMLVIVAASLVAASYAAFRRASEGAAEERLTSVASQLAGLFQQSAAQLRTTTRAAAADPTLGAFARTPTPANRDRALAALRRVEATAPAEQVVALELRDAAGKVVASTAPGAPAPAIAPTDLFALDGRGDSTAVGDFRRAGDRLVYPIVARVPGGDLYLVRWRRLVGTRRTREQINQLIGSRASVFLGGAGGAWTDLERIVAPPPTLPADSVSRYDRGDGERTVATSHAVAGTPWTVVVAFPERVITEPVSAFLRRLGFVALAAMVLALAITWWVSRRITTPLVQLTDAATALAAGDYARRVRIRRWDELGRLGDAFSTMAAEVQHARQDLEAKVEARTHDLNRALRELHEAQETLVRKERLAMLGQLSSGVGHELRNPLGVMTNAIYYLKAVLADPPPNVREYLDILQQQVTLSGKIVGDLLDFARSKPPQRASVRLREATEAEVGRFGQADGIQLAVDVPDVLPPVLVDRTQLGQVLINLLTNAAQAVEGNGRIELRARAVDGVVRLDVSDDGPGIAPANLDKVFEPLFTTKARGIGLGLAVSRQLARANGGDLTVDSVEGQGATFHLTLPLAT